MGPAAVFTDLFTRGQGIGDYWEGTYQYMDWLQLFDVVLFYIIFLIATLLLLGGFELAATYTSFREELVDKRNLPSLVSSGLNKVGGFTACPARHGADLRSAAASIGQRCLAARCSRNQAVLGVVGMHELVMRRWQIMGRLLGNVRNLAGLPRPGLHLVGPNICVGC